MMEKGMCDSCNTEIKRVKHMDGYAWACSCQCTKSLGFHPVKWSWKEVKEDGSDGRS